jgi:CheY-like chemotaxis protein
MQHSTIDTGVEERESAGNLLWLTRKKPSPGEGPGRVIVAHADTDVGRSIALLLRYVGFAAIHAGDLRFVVKLLEIWRPEVLLLDTHLDADDLSFVRSVAAHPKHRDLLMIALSIPLLDGSSERLRAAGFDGICERPCSTYSLATLLRGFLTS